MSAIWVLEYLLELFLIGYPCSCLRAIAHDLPWSAVACQVRWVIRTWILMAGSKDFSNMKNVRRKRRSVSPKPGLRGRPMEDKRVKMRRSWRRRERSSPSSTSSDSSSSGAKIEKRVKKAQKVLERRDPAYRAWRDEERTREREKDLRRQGEALAAAMASRWDEALRRCAMVPAGAPHVQSAPVGVSGAFFSPFRRCRRRGLTSWMMKWPRRLLLEKSLPDRRWAGWTSSSKAWSPSRLIVHRKRRAE